MTLKKVGGLTAHSDRIYPITNIAGASPNLSAMSRQFLSFLWLIISGPQERKGPCKPEFKPVLGKFCTRLFQNHVYQPTIMDSLWSIVTDSLWSIVTDSLWSIVIWIAFGQCLWIDSL